MANQKFTPEEIQEKIAKAISKIYDLSHDQWMSVKHYSFTQIAESVGLHRSMISSTIEVLSEKGFIQVEGERTGIIYKWKSELLPDTSFLAKLAYEKLQQKRKEWNTSRPRRKPKKDEIPENSPFYILRRESLTLGLPVYFLMENKVQKGIIWAATYSSEEEKRIFYQIKFQSHEIYRDKEKISVCLEDGSTYITNWLNKSEFALSLEELFENLKKSLVK